MVMLQLGLIFLCGIEKKTKRKVVGMLNLSKSYIAPNKLRI